MKKEAILITFTIILFFCTTAHSQEYDFNKHSYRFIKATDYENDPRVHQYDVGFYFLDLELDNNSVNLSGNVRIDLDLETEYNDELVFELKSDMTVDSVKVNGQIKIYVHLDDLIVIDYVHSVDYNEDYQVSAIVYYHGIPSDGMFNEAEYYESQLFNFTYSLTEPYFSKYWFPCKQVLYDKADSSYFYVTIPEDLKAGVNGVLVNEYNIGGGLKRMEWQSSYPINFYLISVAVADYMDYSFNAEIPNYSANILVQNFIPNNTDFLDNNDWYINRTEEMLVALSDVWGLFPFSEEKYGHCIVPLGGGMEHQTMTTLGSFDFRLVVHELSHSWFGDYVTCGTWQDIWVNEGFASYGEYLGEELIQPEGNALTWLQGCQSLAKEAPTGSVYVPFEEINSVSRIFDYRLSYRKGACLVHMIRYMIDDDDLFFSTLREFLSIYGNSTATAEDLKVVLEFETGIEFDDFFNEWYYGEGFPSYSAVWYQNGVSLHVEMTQTTSASATSLFTIPMEFKITYDDSSFEIVRYDVDANLSTYDIPVSGNVIDCELNSSFAVLCDVFSIQKSNKETYPEKFSVFPNPSVDNNIRIFADVDSDFSVTISTLEGKEIFSSTYSGQEVKPDLSAISDGIYIIRISTGTETYTEKLVIN
jgi:aminopeptidase N